MSNHHSNKSLKKGEVAPLTSGAKVNSSGPTPESHMPSETSVEKAREYLRLILEHRNNRNKSSKTKKRVRHHHRSTGRRNREQTICIPVTFTSEWSHTHPAVRELHDVAQPVLQLVETSQTDIGLKQTAPSSEDWVLKNAQLPELKG